MNRSLKKSLAAFSILLSVTAAHAEIKLPAQFTSHMVIQQKKPVRLWGTAEPGEAIKVTLAGRSAETKADDSGKFKVELPPLDAKADAGPHELVLVGKNTITLKNVVVGEVWLCSGQSNMRLTVKECANADAEIKAANHDQIRLLYVPDASTPTPQTNFQGKWVPCAPRTVGQFSAAAYYFGRELHKELGVPIGLIDSSRGWSPGEAWIPLEVLESDPITKPIVDRHRAMLAKSDLDQQEKDFQTDLKLWREEQAKAKEEATKAGKTPSTQPTRPRPRRAWGVDPRLRPAGLYNAMLAPLAPMSLGGVIWYQGESNTDRAVQYRTLLPQIITHWRTVFDAPNLPFGIVQLPQHVNKEKPADGTWAELREAQHLTARNVPSTGMIVTTDIGESYNIHPVNKQDVGKRLAGWALNVVYGKSEVPTSPIYKSAKVEGNAMRIEFDGNFKSLELKSNEGFTMAGADRKFVKADVKVDGRTVVVSSPEVQSPVAVRFGFLDDPKATLFSSEGLPASPFRTDDWPGLTDQVRTVDWQ